MPIIVVKGLPSDEEDRLAALRLKKKLKADSRTSRAAETHTGSGIARDYQSYAMGLVGALHADDNIGDAAADSSDEHDEETIYRRAKQLYARPEPSPGPKSSSASTAVGEGAGLESEGRRTKRPLPTAYMTPLAALTDLMTLQVYSVSRQGPWDTAPPVAKLLGGNMGFAGVGTERKAADDADFQQNLRDARKGAECSDADTGAAGDTGAARGTPGGSSSSSDGGGGEAANKDLAGPTPLQRLRLLRAKSSCNRPASKDQRLSDLVKVSEERKHVVKQGATIAAALSPRGALCGATSSRSVIARGGVTGSQWFPAGQPGIETAAYPVSSERHEGMRAQCMYSLATHTTAPGDPAHSQSTRRSGAGASRSGGAIPAGSTDGGGPRNRRNSRDSRLDTLAASATGTGPQVPSMDLGHTHAQLEAQQKRARFLAALDWAMSVTGRFCRSGDIEGHALAPRRACFAFANCDGF